MKNCVIHYGIFKTGSSSIQHSFWQRLNNPQWKYLDLGSPNHGGALSMVIKSELQRRQKIEGIDQETFQKRRSQRQARLLEELEADAENVLISAEWLSSTALTTSELAGFRELLSTRVDTLSVVGYIRPPKAYIESSFQEKLKHGSPKFDLNRHYADYRERMIKFDEVFGKENVSVWKFDPATFPDQCVVQDFCQRLGIHFPLDSIVRVNESLSREATAFLHTYRKLGPGLGVGKSVMRQNDLLAERIATLRGSKLRFSWEAIRPVLEKNAADIEWIENRMGEPFNELHEADDANSVSAEDDLLQYKLNDLLWLAVQLGPDYVERCHPQMKPQEVADWIHLLHGKLAQEAGLIPGK